MARISSCVAVALLAASCARSAAPTASRGVLDLRGWDADGPIVLNGDWALYWQQLVDSADPGGEPDLYMPDSIWANARLANGQRLPGRGYASYRLVVHLPNRLLHSGEPIGLEVATAATAQRVLVHDEAGHLLGSFDSGRVGTDAASTVALVRFGTITVTAAEPLIVTVQVSNFTVARGGAFSPIVLSTATEIRSRESRARSLDFFIVGILFFIGLHHLIMFALRRSEKGPLWLGLFCLVMAARPLLTQHYLEATWSDPRLYTVTFRSEYLTFFGAVPIFAMFIRTLFPRHTDRPIARVVILLMLPFIAAALLAPPLVVTTMLPAAQLITVGGIAWVLYVLVEATRHDRDVLALFMLLGFAVLGGAVIHDFLRVRMMIQSAAYWTQYGVAAFLMFQSALLAVMNDRARRRVESTAREIDALNSTLRRQIVDRSTQLQQALTLIGRDQSSHELSVGQLLAGYRIERRLGAGGMGIVYEAVRESDSRRVALKVIRGDVKPAVLARFAREARVVAGLCHPNIVVILDVGVEAGEFYLAMELVTGGSVEDRRGSFGQVAWALPLLRQFAGALAAIHHGGVVHRDLKPANLLLDGETLKVADFGIASVRSLVSLASIAQAELDETKQADPALTQAGMFLGSPLYMAPELAGGADRASVYSDVFSFGLVAYEMITGQRPFARAPVIECAAGRPPPPAPSLLELQPRLDPQIAALLDRCLRLEPNWRPTSDELRAGFDRG
jgi:hypothetical protein